MQWNCGAIRSFLQANLFQAKNEAVQQQHLFGGRRDLVFAYVTVVRCSSL